MKPTDMVVVAFKLNELIAAIRHTGVGGTLTLKLKLKPTKVDLHEGVKEITVSHQTDIVKPEEKLGASVFFVTQDGRLSRTDPDQIEMFESKGGKVGCDL